MSDGRPPKEPKTRTLTCAAPGPPHTFTEIVRGGRPPKFCPEHRRTKSVERSELAYQARRRIAEDMARRAVDTREAGQVVRLAAGLRVFDDPERAAKLFGVDVRGQDLEALATRARAEHAELINGDMRETAYLAEAVAHVCLVEAMERVHEMPVREVANLLRVALEARSVFVGSGVGDRYVSFTLAVTPPPADGKLTPEQIAKVRGSNDLRGSVDGAPGNAE